MNRPSDFHLPILNQHVNSPKIPRRTSSLALNSLPKRPDDLSPHYNFQGLDLNNNQMGQGLPFKSLRQAFIDSSIPYSPNILRTNSLAPVTDREIRKPNVFIGNPGMGEAFPGQSPIMSPKAMNFANPNIYFRPQNGSILQSSIDRSMMKNALPVITVNKSNEYSSGNLFSPTASFATTQMSKQDTVPASRSQLRPSRNFEREPLNTNPSFSLQASGQETLITENSFIKKPQITPIVGTNSPDHNSSFHTQYQALPRESTINRQGMAIPGFNVSMNLKIDRRSKYGSFDESFRSHLQTDKLVGLPIYQDNSQYTARMDDDDLSLLKQRLTVLPNKSPIIVPDLSGNKRFGFSVPVSKFASKQTLTQPTTKNEISETSRDVSPEQKEKKKKKKKKKLNDDENEDQQGERKKKELLRPRNPKAKFFIKIWFWIIVYPTLMRNEVEKNTTEKGRRVNLRAPETVKTQVNHAARFIRSHILKTLESLYYLDSSISIFPPKKKGVVGKSPSKKEVHNRSKKISERLIMVLKDLTMAVSTQELPLPLLDYLASISENLQRIPSGFLFEFELVRLEISQFLALKNMTPERSQMVIGMFFLVRMLVYYFLTQPWTAYKKIQEFPLLVENLFMFSSVLYHVILDYFRERLPVIENNQAAIKPEKRLYPRNGPLIAFKDHMHETDKYAKDEIIIGLYSKEMLAPYFATEHKSVETMKVLIEECLKELYSKVHQVHLELHKKSEN